MFQDQVVPFVFDRLPVRGEIISLTRSWRRMLENHAYEPVVRDTLGHAAAATGLIAQSLKFDGAVTLQVQGRGDLRMLVMQCTSELELRGLATPAPAITATTFGELMQSAHCAITIDAGDRPYQGIVEVQRDSLAASLEHYFARSVQIPSHVALVSSASRSGGLLLQQMPGERIDEDDWHRLGLLAGTLTLPDLSRGSGLELIGRLFAEDDVRVFTGRPVAFRCRCSKRRTEDVLRMLGREEVESALAEQGSLDVTCEYCGRRRRFDAVDASRLFADNVVRGPDRPQ